MRSTKLTASWPQLNPMITKGKRNEENVELALSLQDVFSDSANLLGRKQKTSCQSETGQGKMGAT